MTEIQDQEIIRVLLTATCKGAAITAYCVTSAVNGCLPLTNICNNFWTVGGAALFAYNTKNPSLEGVRTRQ